MNLPKKVKRKKNEKREKQRVSLHIPTLPFLILKWNPLVLYTIERFPNHLVGVHVRSKQKSLFLYLRNREIVKKTNPEPLSRLELYHFFAFFLEVVELYKLGYNSVHCPFLPCYRPPTDGIPFASHVTHLRDLYPSCLVSLIDSYVEIPWVIVEGRIPFPYGWVVLAIPMHEIADEDARCVIRTLKCGTSTATHTEHTLPSLLDWLNSKTESFRTCPNHIHLNNVFYPSCLYTPATHLLFPLSSMNWMLSLFTKMFKRKKKRRQ